MIIGWPGDMRGIVKNTMNVEIMETHMHRLQVNWKAAH